MLQQETQGRSVQLPNILVIDDDELFHHLISAELRNEYSVVAASNGLDGYLQATRSPPDLAIIDILMPEWDGFRTLDVFRANASLAQVKIILLTADSSRSLVVQAIQRGADALLLKQHFSGQILRDKILELLG